MGEHIELWGETNRMRPTVVASCLALLLAGATGCGPSESSAPKPKPATSSSPSPSPSTQSSENVATITGTQLQSDIDTAVGLETSRRAEVSYGTTVVVRFARTEGPPLRIDFAAGKRRIRIIGKTVYLSPTKANHAPSGIAWIRFSPADLQKTTQTIRRQLIAARHKMANQSDDFAMLGHVDEFFAAGERMEGPSLVRGWSGLAPMADLLADPVTREMVLPMSRDVGKTGEIGLEIWLDSQNRPALLTMHAGSVSVDARYSGWGDNVKIATPAPGTWVTIR